MTSSDGWVSAQEICDAATDGEWSVEQWLPEDREYEHQAQVMADSHGPNYRGVAYKVFLDDANFIAFFNPQRVRAMLAEVEVLQSALAASAVREADLRGEVERLAARALTAESKVRAVEMVHCWTNEDGKRFMFVDDVAAALDIPGAAAAVPPAQEGETT